MGICHIDVCVCVRACVRSCVCKHHQVQQKQISLRSVVGDSLLSTFEAARTTRRPVCVSPEDRRGSYTANCSDANVKSSPVGVSRLFLFNSRAVQTSNKPPVPSALRLGLVCVGL